MADLFWHNKKNYDFLRPRDISKYITYMLETPTIPTPNPSMYTYTYFSSKSGIGIGGII